MTPFKKRKAEFSGERAFNKKYAQIIAKRKSKPEQINMVEFANNLLTTTSKLQSK